MEDIRRRTEFNHVGTQIQALDKLYHEVRKKRPGGKLLSAATPEYLELKTLWQYTGDEQNIVARHTCSLWTRLLRENEADFTYVLNGFLNQVPTARSLQGITEGVSDLLELQIMLKIQNMEAYKCPFGIRNPPHPYITILMNRPADSWSLLLDQVVVFLTHPDYSVSQNAIACLDPFLKFILLDPKGNEQYTMIRMLLKTTLIDSLSQMADRNSKNRWFAYLLQLMSEMQMASKEQVYEVTHFWGQLLSCYNSHITELEDSLGDRLGVLAICLLSKNHQYGLGITNICTKLLDVSKTKPEIFSSECNLAVLCELLVVVYPTDKVYLFNMVKLILKSSTALPSLCSGLAFLAAINQVAAPVSSSVQSQKILVNLATEIIILIQNKDPSYDEKVEDSFMTTHLSTEVYSSQTIVQLAKMFSRDTAQLEEWVLNLGSIISRMMTFPINLTNLLAAVLLQCGISGTCKLAVTRIIELAKQQPSQAPLFLPVFLFALNKTKCSSLKLFLMEALPELATHKYCVPPVLKVVQSLGLNPKLKSLSIRLLTDLWKIQNRCFPMLLSAITDGKGNPGSAMATLAGDVLIAKAAAIRDICQLKPEQHGSEVLGPLSDILDTCTDERGGPAAALALEALYYICQAEVIDIVSTWKVLETKLLKETRPVVIEKICDLLSLVPQLPASSKAYEVFLEETVRRLWLYAQSECPKVVVGAYQALSHFRTEHFKLSHFKYKIVEDFVLQAQAVVDQSETEGETIDSVIPTPPAVCYIRLLQEQNDSTLEGYESFLSALVGKEFENLPRGIYYSATRRHGASAKLGKAVASIPGLIQTQYENTNQPGLRPGLAAGLLFCYDPPVAISRDGRPRLHYAISHGKNYQQMFQCLLNDVSVPPTDWHMMALMPTAWSLFVERLFGSMLLARKAEVDIQRNRDFIDEKEAEEKKQAAWLWARDSLVEVIKKASKGNPSVQANAILALAGLVSATQRYVVSLDREERRHIDDITEHMSNSHWTMTVIDSCFSVIDVSYNPRSSLIGLCQQRTVDDRLPASILAQAAGILAISELVPVLISHYVENVYTVLDKLMGWLPGQPEDDECPPVLHLCRGIALGKFLAKLVNESFADVESSKGSLALMKSLDALETCCFSGSPHRTGSLIGLGICLNALCQDGKTDSRVHVVSVLNKMVDKLQGLQLKDDIYPVFCVLVTMAISTGFISNVVDIELANKVLDLLINNHQSSVQLEGAALSLGLLCHSLIVGGHPNVAVKAQSLYSDWIKVAHDKTSPPIENLAALSGLMAITGSEKLLISVSEGTQDLPGDMKIDAVIRTASQIMTSCDDVRTQGSAAWLLGNLYLSLNSSPQSSSAVQVSYSYLPESSCLRAIVDFLIQASKQGPEYIPSNEVVVCLKALQEEVSGSLPPLNWTGLLSPLMKLPFGEGVKLQCVQLAMLQCVSSTTASLFVSSWCVPPLYSTLPVACQWIILSKTDVIMKSVTPATFQNFLEKSCYPAIMDNTKGSSLSLAALKGLKSALTVTDPPESTVSMLHKMTTKVFGDIKGNADTGVLRGISECLEQVPVQIFDDITNGDCTDNQSVIRGTLTRCYLVGSGKQPIAVLNSCIDAAFNIDCDHERVLYYLGLCFYQMTHTETVHTRVMQRVQWLLEIMGHIRNIATGSYPVALPVNKVLEFAINIVSVAIGAWTSKVSAAMFNLNTTDLKPHVILQQFETKSQEPEISRNRLAIQPIDYLRCCIGSFEKEPWNQILPKMIDWLLMMVDLGDIVLSKNIKDVFRDCVHVLRSTPDYCKIAVWTRAVSDSYSNITV